MGSICDPRIIECSSSCCSRFATLTTSSRHPHHHPLSSSDCEYLPKVCCSIFYNQPQMRIRNLIEKRCSSGKICASSSSSCWLFHGAIKFPCHESRASFISLSHLSLLRGNLSSLPLTVFHSAFQLKEKLKEIEHTMGEREAEILSENLRTEYTRQLENIRRLKSLYEQRARSADAEIEILKRKLNDKNTEIDNELLK